MGVLGITRNGDQHDHETVEEAKRCLKCDAFEQVELNNEMDVATYYDLD